MQETQKRILIVDDEAEIIKLLQIILESAGYSVMAAYDGETAIRKATLDQPDLVVLDIMLPSINGYFVCEKLKNDERTKHIPVIMLTAKSMGEDVQKALEKKADWYITKPFDNKYLLRKIKEFIHKKEVKIS